MHAPSGWAPLPDLDLIAAALPEQRAPYGGGSSKMHGRERDWGGRFSEGQSGSGVEAAGKPSLASSPSGVRPEPMQQALPRSPGEGMQAACAGSSRCKCLSLAEREWAMGLVYPVQTHRQQANAAGFTAERRWEGFSWTDLDA